MTSASELCTRCALCCDGTLFGHVPLEVGDVDRLHGRVSSAPGLSNERLTQPCAALEADRCGVYEARPSACARYRCLLLIALEEGRVEGAAALALVERARALAGDLAGWLSAEQRSRGIWRGSEARLDELAASAAARDRAALGEIVRLRMVLSLLVVQHFDPEAARLGSVHGA